MEPEERDKSNETGGVFLAGIIIIGVLEPESAATRGRFLEELIGEIIITGKRQVEGERSFLLGRMKNWGF